MAENATRKKGKKNRKHDRNRKWCESYRARGQREKNKVKKLLKHLNRFPDDLAAKRVLANLKGSRKGAL